MNSKKDKKKNVVPYYITYTLTANKEQKGNAVPRPPENNVDFAKKCVDENHK